MRLAIQKKNITDGELAKALVGLIKQEGIAHEVAERLQKAEDHEHEQIPEKYVEHIAQKLSRDFRSIMLTLGRNIDLWFAYQAKGKRGFLRKADGERPPVLTQRQIDELRYLIENHFRRAIGIEYLAPQGMQRRWKRIGIHMPYDNLQKWIQQAYVAGRLGDVLSHGSTYGEMLKLARKLPMSRMDQLTLQAAQQNAAKYIKGYGTKLADLAEDMLLNNHKSAVHDVVQRYFSGELTHTLYNEQGFTPQEAESLLSTKKVVRGWHELATELKNRFKAVDAQRDWDRVAVTEVRHATNIGRLMNIQIEGGGNPDKIEVYYHVQDSACKYCKQMYLEPDGTPKVFKLSEVLNNVQRTGGMQIGLKASLIGQEGGWVANATCHPFGHCYPVRKMDGYNFIPRGDLRT